MKKTITTILLLVIFAACFQSNVAAAPLQDQTVLAFSELGLSTDMVLHGPFDTNSIRFELTPTWVLDGDGELELIVSAYFAGESGEANSEAASTENDFIGAVLDVYFNDKLQQSVSLRSGVDIRYKVPIAAADTASPYPDGSFKISFFLDAAIDCDYDFHQTTVAISSNSTASLSYTEVPLPLDLHRLPWPFYQKKAHIVDSTMVVIPSSPSSKEIQSAMIVMGIFGRASSGKLPMSLVTVDALAEDLKAQSHLIFIGKPASFPGLSSIPFPVPITNGKFTSAGLTDNDGILELFTSPWNKDKAILVVGGNTDDAVVKAAQALSTGNIQTGTSADYAIVAQVNPTTTVGVMGANAKLLSSPKFTLEDLGYYSETVSDLGINWFSYDFTVPAGQVPSGPPTLEILFSHSALIDANRSDVSVYFNEVLTGSVKLSDEQNNLVSVEIKLPMSGVKPGINNISVSANLIPRDDCSLSSFTGLWMTVYSESKLYVPLIASPSTTYSLQDLNSYPYPFANDPSLSSTTFVIPRNDPAAWAVAGTLAYHLGQDSMGSILNPGLVFDDEFTEETRSQDLIIVGLPNDLKIVSELKKALPAYFETGSNVAVLESQQVIYRISADKSLGYLELFISPWNKQRAVLAVLGTTSDGVRLAADTLLTPKVREVLNGDFVTVDGDRPIVVDTRTGSGMGRVASEIGQSDVSVEQNPELAPSEVLKNTSDTYDGKRLILFGLIGTLVLIVIVVAITLELRRVNR